MSERWAETLQKMYDSEIDFEISTFWDSGFHWKLGSETNGFTDTGCTYTFGEAVECLEIAAHRRYPESAFHLGRTEHERRWKEQQAKVEMGRGVAKK